MFENYVVKIIYEGIGKASVLAHGLPKPKISSLEGHFWVEPLSSHELNGKYLKCKQPGLGNMKISLLSYLQLRL